MRPSTLTIAVPTIGRPTLRHTLDSIRRQRLLKGDRVLVVLDSFEQGDRADVAALVDSYGPPFEYHVVNGGVHFFGNPQFNYAMTLADTDAFCGLGDDDVYIDGAFDRIRATVQPGRALLHQFLSPWRTVLWDQPRLRVAHISGCCLVAPVAALVPVKPDARIETDFDWIVDVLAKTGHPPIWLADVLVLARPDLRDGEPVHRGVTVCAGCHRIVFLEDVTAGRCPFCVPVEVCA